MTTVYRLWHGEIPLPDAFWNWAVIGGLLVNIASSILFLYLVTADRPVAALIVGYAPSIPYNVLVTVAVWRSAERYEGERKWADLARTVTVIGMVLLSVT
ncbi:MAG: hypothetical protein MJE12_01600 [Alphaproteobacteria bacterium]|nr:hypothetical protein [Alphaproteobacteria bacterium]